MAKRRLCRLFVSGSGKERVYIIKIAEGLAGQLSRDCFSGDIDCASISGFNNCSYTSMGVNRSSFIDEIKFPEPEGIEKVVYASEYDVRADVKEDMREKLAASIQKVKALGAGFKKLVLPSGNIYLYGTSDKDGDNYALSLEGIEDLYVEGGGATLMLDDSLGGIAVCNCANVTIKNICIDRMHLPYFMGTVEYMDAASREAVVIVNEGCEIEDNFPAREYLEFDALTKEPRYHGNFLYNNTGVDGSVLEIKSFRRMEGRRFKIEFGCEINAAPAGTGFVVSGTMYGKDSMVISHCKDISIENINIFSSPGMGVRGYSSDNIRINRVNVMCKPDTDRLMSVTADAMHFIDCGKALEITNCLFENSHDDSLNVHGMYMMITHIDSRTGRVKFAAARTVRFGKPDMDDPLTIPFCINDCIEISRDKTLELKYIRTVSSCERAEDYGYWVTFNEGIAGIVEGDIFSNITRTPGLMVRNCIFRNKRNRGILIQTRDALVENNTFYNVIMTGIQILSDCANWYESLNPRNVTLRNNKFINTNIKTNNFGDYGHGDIDICVYGREGNGEAGLIKDILIENNAFINSGNAAISINSAEDVTVRNNFIYRPCSETTDSPANCAISVSKARGLQLKDNCIIPAQTKGFMDVCFGEGAELSSIAKDNMIIE